MSNENKGDTTRKLGLVVVATLLVTGLSISMPAKIVGPLSFVIGVLFSIIWDNLFFAEKDSE